MFEADSLCSIRWVLQLYSCIDAIDGLLWSCDSEYVLCSITKRGVAQVRRVIDHEWHLSS